MSSSPPPTDLPRYIPPSDTVRNDMMRYGTMLNRTVRCNETRSIRYDTVQFDTRQCNAECWDWYGSVRNDMIRQVGMYSTIRYGMIRYDTIWYDTPRLIRYSTIRDDTVWLIHEDRMWWDTVRYDTMQCSKDQYGTVQYAQYEVRRYGTKPYDFMGNSTLRCNSKSRSPVLTRVEWYYILFAQKGRRSRSRVFYLECSSVLWKPLRLSAAVK